MKILIWGHSGWIGKQIIEHLNDLNNINNLESLDDDYQIVYATSRLECYSKILKEIGRINPDRIICSAALTGTPNVDWCEINVDKTYLINTIGIYNLTYAAKMYGIHVTFYSSGCIYANNEKYPIPYAFSEEDEPNFDLSIYSKSKIYAEKMLSHFDNILILRLRMPITYEKHIKNLITKLSNYKTIVNIPNSITVLPDLLPISIDMMKKQYIGIYNFVNPGYITHNDILVLYKEYIDNETTWDNVSNDMSLFKAPRSNCILSMDKLLKLYNVRNISDAIIDVVKNYS